MDGEDHNGVSGAAADATPNSSKRKRSSSADGPPAVAAPPTKTIKTHSSSHLQINYLARQNAEVLPLVSGDDTLPVVLKLLSDYSGVLERHESLASNLGARPLGPILIQRFERLFDGQPRVLKSHGKDGGSVSWLDVVEFARQKPEQFNLEKARDGTRVCQFNTKQCRVEISEDDFTVIASGMPQKLIPPQPISEDEEKELGTLEILEKRITTLIQLADQVSARARQTKHRITSRRSAIASRREGEQLAEKARSGEHDGSNDSGFRAVNRPDKLNGLSGVQNTRLYSGASASPTTHAELLSCFTSSRQRLDETADFASPTSSRPSGSGASGRPKAKSSADNIDYAGILLNSATPVAVPTTPSTVPNSSQRPSQAERYDDSGPFKAEMLSRMENMSRGERVMPPCDRCRRLHMDCLKNLTACLGCTKKHAKCSWKEVTDQELVDHPFTRPRNKVVGDSANRRGSGDGASILNGADGPNIDDDPSQPVRDEELLGEDDSDDEPLPSPPRSASPTRVKPAAAATGNGTTSPERSRAMSPVDVTDASIKAEVSAAADASSTNITVPDPTAPGDPPMPPEKVEQAARQILEKRFEERGEDLTAPVNGFRSVNRPPTEAVATVESEEVNGNGNGVVKQPSVAV